MREQMRSWFSTEAKSFEILITGEGRKTKVIITVRNKGFVSWVRFGVEGVNILLKGLKKAGRKKVSSFLCPAWKENGRSYSLVCRENRARIFILCTVIDADGNRNIFIPEGGGPCKWVGSPG